jgi:hypothetical protein
MTRINVGISPEELPNKLLIAEHREITRIPNAIHSGRAKIKDIPEQFTLGKGHVKFFYTRLGYLKKRYYDLYDECLARGINVTPKHDSFSNLPIELCQDYNSTLEDRQLLIDRISLRGFNLLH